jgi:hypothetical protein
MAFEHGQNNDRVVGHEIDDSIASQQNFPQVGARILRYDPADIRVFCRSPCLLPKLLDPTARRRPVVSSNEATDPQQALLAENPSGT